MYHWFLIVFDWTNSISTTEVFIQTTCLFFSCRCTWLHCCYGEAFALSAEDAAGPWLDPHLARGGWEWKDAPHDLPSIAKPWTPLWSCSTVHSVCLHWSILLVLHGKSMPRTTLHTYPLAFNCQMSARFMPFFNSQSLDSLILDFSWNCRSAQSSATDSLATWRKRRS